MVATGSIWGGPLSDLSGTKEELLQSARTWQDKFKNAKKIVIAGAGSVGLGEGPVANDRIHCG